MEIVLERSLLTGLSERANVTLFKIEAISIRNFLGTLFSDSTSSNSHLSKTEILTSSGAKKAC